MSPRIQWLAAGMIFISSIALADVPDSAQTDFAVSRGNSLDGPTAANAGPSTQSKASATVAGDSTSSAASQLSYMWPVSSRGALLGTVAASAPISGTSAPKPALGSVSALSAGINAKLSATYFLLPPIQSFDRTTAYENHFNDDCDTYVRSIFGAGFYYNPTQEENARDPHGYYWVGGYIQNSCFELTDQSTLRAAVTQINAKLVTAHANHPNDPLPKAIVLPAGWQDTAKSARALLLGDHDKYVPSSSMPPLMAFGLSFLGNQQNYSYVTASAPSKILKSSEEGWGIGGNFTVLLEKVSFILGYSYEKPYKAGMGQQVCEPIGTSTSTTCSAANVGAPTQSLDHIFSAEMRLLAGAGIAVGPRLEYSKDTANLGASLPVYFVPNKKSALNGGIQVGWTRQGGYQGAVLLTKAFSFLD